MGRRFRRTITAGLVAGAALAPAAGASAAIRDIPLPVNAAGTSTYSWERPITNWNGAIWVAAQASGGLVRIGVDGQVSQVPVPIDTDEVSGSGPSTLTPGAEASVTSPNRGATRGS